MENDLDASLRQGHKSAQFDLPPFDQFAGQGRRGLVGFLVVFS